MITGYRWCDTGSRASRSWIMRPWIMRRPAGFTGEPGREQSGRPGRWHAAGLSLSRSRQDPADPPFRSAAGDGIPCRGGEAAAGGRTVMRVSRVPGDRGRPRKRGDGRRAAVPPGIFLEGQCLPCIRVAPVRAVDLRVCGVGFERRVCGVGFERRVWGRGVARRVCVAGVARRVCVAGVARRVWGRGVARRVCGGLSVAVSAGRAWDRENSGAGRPAAAAANIID
jgi:hypothetical protein